MEKSSVEFCTGRCRELDDGYDDADEGGDGDNDDDDDDDDDDEKGKPDSEFWILWILHYGLQFHNSNYQSETFCVFVCFGTYQSMETN